MSFRSHHFPDSFASSWCIFVLFDIIRVPLWLWIVAFLHGSQPFKFRLEKLTWSLRNTMFGRWDPQTKGWVSSVHISTHVWSGFLTIFLVDFHQGVLWSIKIWLGYFWLISYCFVSGW
jgi:hypothetical protein